jgi:hypothetical protein
MRVRLVFITSSDRPRPGLTAETQLICRCAGEFRPCSRSLRSAEEALHGPPFLLLALSRVDTSARSNCVNCMADLINGGLHEACMPTRLSMPSRRIAAMVTCASHSGNGTLGNYRRDIAITAPLETAVTSPAFPPTRLGDNRRNPRAHLRLGPSSGAPR